MSRLLTVGRIVFFGLVLSSTSCAFDDAASDTEGTPMESRTQRTQALPGPFLTLSESQDSNWFELEIQNPLSEPLTVPAALVNGPRNPSKSIFIVVTDVHGKRLNRCAVVEVNDRLLHSYSLQQNERKTIPFSRFMIENTYCVKTYRLQAFIGAEDRYAASTYRSNVLRID